MDTVAMPQLDRFLACLDQVLASSFPAAQAEPSTSQPAAAI